MCTSVPHTLAASTRTSSSPGPGSGTGHLADRGARAGALLDQRAHRRAHRRGVERRPPVGWSCGGRSGHVDVSAGIPASGHGGMVRPLLGEVSAVSRSNSSISSARPQASSANACPCCRSGRRRPWSGQACRSQSGAWSKNACIWSSSACGRAVVLAGRRSGSDTARRRSRAPGCGSSRRAPAPRCGVDAGADRAAAGGVVVVARRRRAEGVVDVWSTCSRGVAAQVGRREAEPRRRLRHRRWRGCR